MDVRALIGDLPAQLNEKEFEIPFRCLLRSLGHSTIFERTRHGPGEHGKDIVSLSDTDAVRTVNVFQLKTGHISTSRFRREVRPELDAMVDVPIRHTMVRGTEPILYTLVSTGDLSPDAAEEFHAYNERNVERQRPIVQFWNRPELVNLFHRNMASLPIFLPELQDDLARIWLNLKSGEYNRVEWSDFVAKVLDLNRQITKRSLLFLGLATSFLTTQMQLGAKHFIAFDTSRIALVKMWAAISHLNDETISVFDNLHEEYCSLIWHFIETCDKDFAREKGLYRDGRGFIESILYPLRTFSTLGTISYLAYCAGKQGKAEEETQLVRTIETIIRNNPCVLTPPADSLRKDIAITLRELCANGMSGIAEKWIEEILENLHQRYIRSGWWPSESDSPQDIVENAFHFREEGKKEQPVSFLVPILFKFCVKLGARRIYDRYTPLFEDFRLMEFIPAGNTSISESELIQGNLEHGTTIEKRFPRNFADYCRQVLSIRFQTYSPIERNRPQVLHMITDVHSQYVFPEIYLDFNSP